MYVADKRLILFLFLFDGSGKESKPSKLLRPNFNKRVEFVRSPVTFLLLLLLLDVIDSGSSQIPSSPSQFTAPPSFSLTLLKARPSIEDVRFILSRRSGLTAEAPSNIRVDLVRASTKAAAGTSTDNLTNV